MKDLLNTIKQLVFGWLCLIHLSGCATFTTLDAQLPLYQKVFIFSGTRLDWAALSENDVAIRKFKVTPPRYPILDLPFSFAADSVFLPATVYAEIFH
ncbi:MAG: YceK/YidQ family lipoprotein [Methylococcales bacterium]